MTIINIVLNAIVFGMLIAWAVQWWHAKKAS